jgi:general secretion pathway protein A
VSSSNTIAPEVYYRDKSLLPSRVAYEGFFGLKENPFSLTPDPRYLFRTRHAHETLRQLTRGILTRKGLILLTGEVGTGKTTLLNTALSVLKENPEVGRKTRTSVVVHPTLTPEELVEAILSDFKVPCTATRKPRRLQILQEMLLDVHRKGGVAVLAVDEAQLLTPELLDEIRLLLSRRCGPDELLQIVLCGHPEIEEKLDRSALCRPRPPVIIRCNTAPLTLPETNDYIEHRLKVAGAQSESMFTKDAAGAVYLHSRGIPRVVNLLCAHALSAAGMRGIRHITSQMIDEAAAKMPFPNGKPPGRRSRGQRPGNFAPPAPPMPPASHSSSGGIQEHTLPPAAAVLRREFLNASKTPAPAAHFRRSPFRAKPSAPPRPQPSPPSNRQLSPIPILPRTKRLNRWWTTEFAKKKDWILLCYVALVGVLFLTVAQSVGSATRVRHAVRATLGFSGLLLLDVSLGLVAYFCIVESRARSRANDPAKPYWPAYKRIPELISLAGLRLARLGARDSAGRP